MNAKKCGCILPCIPYAAVICVQFGLYNEIVVWLLYNASFMIDRYY